VNFTIKKDGVKRPATAYESFYIKHLLRLHIQYWKWFAIRAAAFVVLIVLLVQEYQAHVK
jgi:hypothetical protein